MGELDVDSMKQGVEENVKEHMKEHVDEDEKENVNENVVGECALKHFNECIQNIGDRDVLYVSIKKCIDESFEKCQSVNEKIFHWN